jgi:uncharacterized membrane protein YhaH (DUF805 family)
MSYQTTYASPFGRLSRGNYIVALIILLLVAAFYYQFSKGRNGEWVQATLLYPAFVMLARRLHDMGQTAWLLVLPLAPTVVFLWLHFYSAGSQLLTPLSWASAGLGALFLLWGIVGKGQGEANRFGDPATA